MAPKYAMCGYLTPKADIYSFGVVTLEIVSERNSDSCRPSDQTFYLLDLAYVLQEQGYLMIQNMEQIILNGISNDERRNFVKSNHLRAPSELFSYQQHKSRRV
uniref:Protein kinase domain-containing protein n=1 Tax=Solanum lycopersicum TaxID=4081 RepID=A0A3Q7GQP3_SOLLC